MRPRRHPTLWPPPDPGREAWRQVRAGLEGRTGPGVAQPWRDLRKLARKEPVTPDGTIYSSDIYAAAVTVYKNDRIADVIRVGDRPRHFKASTSVLERRAVRAAEQSQEAARHSRAEVAGG